MEQQSADAAKPLLCDEEKLALISKCDAVFDMARVAADNSVSDRVVETTAQPKLQDDWVMLDEPTTAAPVVVESESASAVQSALCERYRAVLSCSPIDLAELRRMAWKGVPSTMRSDVWRVLLGYLPVQRELWQSELERKRSLYCEMARVYDDKCEHLDAWEKDDRILYHEIRVDLPRSGIPGFLLFSQSPAAQKLLGRAMFIWSKENPSVSYYQGLMDLALVILVALVSSHIAINGDLNKLARFHCEMLDGDTLMELEADMYWCLSLMLKEVAQNACGGDFQQSIDRKLEEVSRIVGVVEKRLYDYIISIDCRVSDFAFRWVICLLVREFRISQAMRLWDMYFAVGPGFSHLHLYVCASLIATYCAKIQGLDFYGFVSFVQRLPLENWTDDDVVGLVCRAYNAVSADAGLIVPPPNVDHSRYNSAVSAVALATVTMVTALIVAAAGGSMSEGNN
eukprot:m51a1_g1272 hypothetical protein (455) ;mRNA; r:97706-99557